MKAVYDKSSGTAPFKAGLDLVDGYLYRSPDFSDDEQVVLENGHKFFVNWTEGQKTGFFLDQRENRALVGKYSRGRNVLNLFCYTGGFSVYASAMAPFMWIRLTARARLWTWWTGTSR